MINQNLLLAGDDSYNISRSLRFRSSASANLSRTPLSTSNKSTNTWSVWLKRGALGSDQLIFGAGTNSSDYMFIRFNTSEQLYFLTGENGATNQNILTSTQVFRDTSAWYHFVFVFDFTNATASERFRIYANNQRVTMSGTMAAQNYQSTTVNTNAVQQSVGKYPLYHPFDGYLTEINFIDGQALTPSSFGETDAITGVWKPKKYAGTYGTNGFYLPFSDNSSTTTLGYDKSGNSNNWTCNNISLTAGTTYDSMTDVPTLTSATQANYCVVNPIEKHAYITTSDGNLRVTGNTTADSGAVSGTIAMPSGKWYWETTITTLGGISYAGFAVTNAQNLSNAETFGIASGATAGGLVRNSGGALYIGYGGYGAQSFTSPSFTTGDVIGVAIDADNGSVYFHKNGTWMNSGVPTSGASKTGATHIWTAGAISPRPAGGGYNGSVNDFNFGQRPFAYTPPTGFLALNTFNLPEPSIKQGNKHFDINTWAGTSSPQTITNSGAFKPDFVWVKARSFSSGGVGHMLADSVRGGNNVLHTDQTAAEQNNLYGAISTFNSNGFTTASGSVNSAETHESTITYVGLQWKANGTGSSNTAGSITSTVSANPSAGFSVVTFNTGTIASSATFGHGLGVAPKMVILKTRAISGTWVTYHADVGNTKYLELNNTMASATAPTIWNNTSPSSSVITIGSGFSGQGNYVAYCLSEVAGYSKFGSYTGNGSADGPFVHLGFRPRFIFIKNSTDGSAGHNWTIWDTARNTYNVGAGGELYANLSSAEVPPGQAIDVLSNGFKIRSDGTRLNQSGSTNIFMAFAENPFKYSLAR